MEDGQRSRGRPAQVGRSPIASSGPAYCCEGFSNAGSAGGDFSTASHTHYGCSTARNKGTCDTRLTITQNWLEQLARHALQARLMDPELRAEKNGAHSAAKDKLTRLEEERTCLIQATMDGVPD